MSGEINGLVGLFRILNKNIFSYSLFSARNATGFKSILRKHLIYAKIGLVFK